MNEITNPLPISAHAGASPAPGSNWSLTIPDNEIWEVYTVKIQLTCDANAANRYANFRYSEATPYILSQTGWSAAITANQVVFITVGNFPTYFFDATNHTVHLPFPFPFRLMGGHTMGFVITGIQAGDQIAQAFVCAAKMSCVI